MTEMAGQSQALWKDYLELTKPRVVALMILTSIVGMLLSVPGWLPLDTLIMGNLGIALMAGSAACINHVIDRRIDLKMARTSNRPVAKGRVQPQQALVFALVTGASGMAILWFFNNPLAAWLTLASLIGYALIYTLYLKRATPQNIVVGGLAGAMPPLLGWVAVTGEIHAHGLLLVLIIFIWTPPHFWALALHRKEDYALADIPMLPVTHGERYTRIQIMLYTLLLFVITLIPWVAGMFGWIYLLGATLLGLKFIYWAFKVLRKKDSGSNKSSGADKSSSADKDRDADVDMNTFKYSIIYLMALFVIMLTDHYLIA